MSQNFMLLNKQQVNPMFTLVKSGNNRAHNIPSLAFIIMIKMCIVWPCLLPGLPQLKGITQNKSAAA